MLRLSALLVMLLLPLSVGRAEPLRLLAEDDGCVWCAGWTKEIGAIYGNTVEGQAAPLMRYDVHSGTPEGVALERTVLYTSTFILVKDGEEVGRIEGYPGADFFWGRLAQIMSRTDVPVGSGPDEGNGS